jgi:hypothetical protein
MNAGISFAREATVAFVLSLVGGALAASLALVLPADGAYRVVVAALGFAYILHRLGRARERVGRVVTVCVWCAVAAAAWLLEPPFAVYVAAHVVLIWAARALYAHSDLRAAALDFVLSIMGLAFAVWAVLRTESFFLAAWCFFLSQAIHVAIPAWAGRRKATGPEGAIPDDRFASAHRCAQEALKRLLATP